MGRAFIHEIGYGKWLRRSFQRQVCKWLFQRDQDIVLPTGNRFILPKDSAFATEVFLTAASVDWGSEGLLCRMIGRSGVFLDVGANIGYYSSYLEPLVDRVFAFEPDPRARTHLVANVGRLGKVSVVSCAVGPKTSTARFVQHEQSERSRIAGAGEQGIEVPVVSIDDFAFEHGLTVSAIKTDVEGHDLPALFGARRVLERQRPLVLSELQPSAALADFAHCLDYRIFAYGREPVSRAIRFVRVDALEARALVFKMLFLVPEERCDEIRALA